MEIFERAKGKINLTLDITGESGGFHLLDMLVATIDLFDDVKITYRADDKIECVQDGEIADEKKQRVPRRKTYERYVRNSRIHRRNHKADSFGGRFGRLVRGRRRGGARR